MTRYVVIGGGILGLATAYRIACHRPGAQVTVLEKESAWGAHQSGHNSNVVHAGLYYRPGSLKARLAVAGNRSMVDFCRAHGVPVEVTGKLVVATSEDELAALHALYGRARVNGVPVRLISADSARRYEPEVSCVAALHVASTAVTDYAAVCRTLAGLLEGTGARLRTGTRVTGLAPEGSRVVVTTTDGEFTADVLVNCAGLHADRVAAMAGLVPAARVVPFRGEYHDLRPAARHLVRGLIYPVPDARFPFLGVHLTRMLDGSVHAGPNAVLATAREGYRRAAVNPRDVLDAAAYPGLWRLGRRHLGYGLSEVARSVSRRRFAASVARLVPAIGPRDLVPGGTGVRAQAVRPDGSLVDDFLVQTRGRQVHILNAPSPAATAALEIARYVVDLLPD
jgi:L-2-hydroxyglutarate oxidase